MYRRRSVQNWHYPPTSITIFQAVSTITLVTLLLSPDVHHPEQPGARGQALGSHAGGAGHGLGGLSGEGGHQEKEGNLFRHCQKEGGW